MNMIAEVKHRLLELWKLRIVTCPEARVAVLAIFPQVTLKNWPLMLARLKNIIKKPLHARVLYRVVVVSEIRINHHMLHHPVRNVVCIIRKHMRKVVSPHHKHVPSYISL